MSATGFSPDAALADESVVEAALGDTGHAVVFQGQVSCSMFEQSVGRTSEEGWPCSIGPCAAVPKPPDQRTTHGSHAQTASFEQELGVHEDRVTVAI